MGRSSPSGKEKRGTPRSVTPSRLASGGTFLPRPGRLQKGKERGKRNDPRSGGWGLCPYTGCGVLGEGGLTDGNSHADEGRGKGDTKGLDPVVLRREILSLTWHYRGAEVPTRKNGETRERRKGTDVQTLANFPPH